MNSLFNSILALYRNKGYEPSNQWSSNRFARQMVNSVLIVVVVVLLIGAVIIFSMIYSLISRIF